MAAKRPNSSWFGAHLKAVVLAEDAAVHGLDDHLLLHAEVQRLHAPAGAEQRLVGPRLLQPRHQMRSGGGREGDRDKLAVSEIVPYQGYCALYGVVAIL